MKNRKGLNIIFGIFMFFSGVILTYIIIYYHQLELKETVTKVEKDVTVTDNGIADAVNKVYDSVIVVGTYKDDKLYATGSGFIYKINGDDTYIMTNHHAVEVGNNYKITLTNGDTVSANLVGSDEYADIAILKINTKEDYKEVIIGNSDSLSVGDTTFAIGAPLDNTYSWTVTRGIISGKERLVEVALSSSMNADYIMNVLQTDDAVNSGNSGGPLCNSNGEVVGVVNAKIAYTGVEGMGFAILCHTN